MVSLELEARLDNLLSTSQEEMANIDIFAPITEREECPICLLSLPTEEDEIAFMPCCGKMICSGCVHKNIITHRKNGVPRHEMKCAFCRQLTPKSSVKGLKKLMKKNNIQSFIQMAERYRTGDGVLQSDTRALEMYIRAAELGHAQAYAHIGHCYDQGSAVEEDVPKSIEFFEVAAKKESIRAYRWIAEFHGINGDNKKGFEYLNVAASAGCQKALNTLMKLYEITYELKLLSKDDLAKTLRAHQASLNDLKSKDRDDARIARASGLYNV